MIYGIGTDIIENKRILESFEKFGDKFLKRIFTEKELAYCENKSDSMPYFAARFAAKEAFLKALGTGLRGNISFKDVEITNDALGKPLLVQNDIIKEIFRERQILACHLSLSHADNYSVANAVLEQ